jgi:hypothetical protein
MKNSLGEWEKLKEEDKNDMEFMFYSVTPAWTD